MLIIPGTGLLTDAFGLSGWGPYGLLKWSLIGKLRRCKVMFVSVGAGPLDSAPGRFFVKLALSLAEYRSYRDVPSREVVEGIGVRAKDDRIYPDLVFGLSPALPPTAAVREGRPVVGLGLMEYSEKYSIASPMRDTYERYVESFAAIVGWLLDHDYDVKLLLGDGDADTFVIDDLRAVLRERLASEVDERVTDHPIGSVHELLSQLRATDLVIATRFHNVLMSLLLGKPVVAISFHHKCSSLMSDMGLSEYCQDINEINADALIAKFQALVQHADERRAHDRAASRGSAIGPGRAVRSSFRRTYRRIPTRPRGDHFDLTNLASQTRRYDAGDAGGQRAPSKGGVGVSGGEQTHLAAAPGTGARSPRDAGVRTLAPLPHFSETPTAQMYLGTLFLRNRPALELMRRLFAERPQGSSVRVAVLGCSVGVEVYSILWTLRRARPDLTILVDAVDISPEVLAIAEEGVYGPQTAETVHESVFERLTEAEMLEMFDWNGDQGRVKPYLREGITWRLGDAADRRLVEELGPKDLVVANNFLCHMDAPSAERCLRNFAQLTSPGGYLFVSGVDLDVRTNVAIDLGWEPVPELMAEIHDGDPLVRADWPWHWWGLEPLDRRRNDWRTVTRPCSEWQTRVRLRLAHADRLAWPSRFVS